MISKETLDEFKKIYKEEYGKGISNEKAMSLGTNLLTMMNVVYRPIEKEWLKEFKENEKIKKDKRK